MDVCERASAGYSVNSFRWSEKDYTLRMIVEMFGHQLPFLVIVTEGYYGVEDWICELPLHEMNWIYGLVSQTRIVVKDRKDVYYSIPECYRGVVLPITDTGVEESPITISELLKCNKYKFLTFTESKMVAKRIGRLQLMDTYEEKFLVTHILQDGNLCPGFTLVPCSVSVKLAIALTTTRGGRKTFFKTMMEFRNLAEGFPHEYSDKLNKLFAEVTVFSGKPHSGDYEYITSLPLQIASNVQSSKVSEQEGFLDCDKQSKRTMGSKGVPVAHNLCTEDRLRQLKLFFLNKYLPEDDVEEGTMLSKTEEVRGQENPKSGSLSSLFAKKKKKREANSCNQKTADMMKEMECTYEDVSTEPLVTPVDVTSSRLYVNAVQDQSCYSKQKKKPLPTEPSVTNETGASGRPDVNVIVGQQPSQSENVSLSVPDQQRRLQCLTDIPIDLSALSVSEVCRCLELLGLSKHKQTMSEHLVDGTMLMCLTEPILLEQFGFSAFEAKQLAMFVGGYRPKL